eukprot:gene7924-16215_t
MNFVKIPDAVKRSLPRFMNEGDLVVIYERHDSMNHIYLEGGQIFNNKFGAFPHNDFIGKPFGSKIFSRYTPGWLYALEPSPDLWTLAVHSRTQVVDNLDSSVITFHLDIYPGCTVVESGTGSGCMSLSIARAISPHGKLFTYEYNAARAETAKEEFIKLGLGDIVHVQCQDVCGIVGDGGFTSVDAHTVDAVFLDLPEPWLTIDHALRVLKPGRNICCYSPCIEQVMKTCEKLRSLGFHIIDFETPDLGPEEETIETIVVAVNGISHGKDEVEVVLKDINSSGDNPSPVVTTATVTTTTPTSTTIGDIVEGKKRRRIEEKEENDIDNDIGVTAAAVVDTINSSNDKQNKPYKRGEQKQLNATPVPGHILNIARPNTSMKGHTAFLTFAMTPSISGEGKI